MTKIENIDIKDLEDNIAYTVCVMAKSVKADAIVYLYKYRKISKEDFQEWEQDVQYLQLQIIEEHSIN